MGKEGETVNFPSQSDKKRLKPAVTAPRKLRSYWAQPLPRQKEKKTLCDLGYSGPVSYFPRKSLEILTTLMFCKPYLRSWLCEPLSNTYLSLKNSDLHCQGYLNHSRNFPRLTELVCNFEFHSSIVCTRQKLSMNKKDIRTFGETSATMNGLDKVGELLVRRWLIEVTDARPLCVCLCLLNGISMISPS